MKGRPSALIGSMNMFVEHFMDDVFAWERPPIEPSDASSHPQTRLQE